MQGSLCCNPSKIMFAPIWNNPTFLKENKPLKPEMYPSLSSKIYYTYDLFKYNSKYICSYEEITNKLGIVNRDAYLEIQSIVEQAVRLLGFHLDDIDSLEPPMQPLIFQILSSTSTGCSRFYKLLRKIKNLDNSSNLLIREEKWHIELNERLSVDLWRSAYQHTVQIKRNNNLKWMQYQIVRNCQFTNYRVNKFKPSISPLCSYCSVDNEKISHLYFGCNFVKNFWIQVAAWTNDFSLTLPLNITSIIFGKAGESQDSVVNCLILWGKLYIWQNKFKNALLSLPVFLKFIFQKIKELKDVCEYLQKTEVFDQWLPIFSVLVQDHD